MQSDAIVQVMLVIAVLKFSSIQCYPHVLHHALVLMVKNVTV